MAEGYEPNPNRYIKKYVVISHGTINSGASSTVTTPLSDLGIGENDVIGGVAITGSYNSEITPWSYYIASSGLTSRLRNDGNNTASGTDLT